MHKENPSLIQKIFYYTTTPIWLFIEFSLPVLIVAVTYPFAMLFVFLTNKKIMDLFCKFFRCGESVEYTLLRLIRHEKREKSFFKRMANLSLYGDDVYRVLLRMKYKNEYILLKLTYGGNNE